MLSNEFLRRRTGESGFIFTGATTMYVLLGLFKKQLFQAGTPANRFSHCLGQYKIGTCFYFNLRPHLGIAPAISIRYRSP